MPASAVPHIVVLDAGFGGLSFVRKFPRDRGRITILDLSVPGYPHVFAIGDLANIVDGNGVAAPA